MSNASFKMNGVEVFSENAQTVTVKNINVDANDTTTPSMCKAWVNFDGTLAMTVNSSYGPDAPPADYSSPNPIRAAYNVDYIIDRGSGDYEIHFENAMPDANYSVVCSGSMESSNVRRGSSVGPRGSASFDNAANSYSTSSIRILTAIYGTSSLNPTLLDLDVVNVTIFR